MTRQELNREARLIAALARDLTPLSDQDLADMAQGAHNGSASADPRSTGTGTRRTVLAAACEAARRTFGYTVHENQVTAALCLTERMIAELPTGEGKTLAAAIAACWLRHSEGGVHILTFNDYLAERDCGWVGPVCRRLGFKTDFVTARCLPVERKAAYGADIVWLTAREAGFDHLRDGMALAPEAQVQRPYRAAIVDEADSLLIDEARTPLVLAGASDEDAAQAYRAMETAAAMTPDADLLFDVNEQQVTLSDEGIRLAERLLGVENLYDGSDTELLEKLHAALTARFLLRRDRDYIVRDGRVLLVDPHTGRVAENRHWPVLLQEAVEVREDLAVSRGGCLLASMTMRHFLRLYPHLSGMTGTASSSSEEFRRAYGLTVMPIEPCAPLRRIDHPDVVHASLEDKYRAVCDETLESHRRGRPVLIGTVDVAESERLAERLRGAGIACRVLNARNDRDEAAVIAQAGLPDAVTVSTNMAGRGVDIRLGGSDEALREQVTGVGGLLVLGTSLHEHRRVDLQLRGRAGRQGDPGESRFHVSLEDELYRRFRFGELVPERVRIRWREGLSDAADPAFARAFRTGQRIVEGYHEDLRAQLTRYQDMPDAQYREMRAQRMRVLAGGRPAPSAESLLPDLFSRCVALCGRPEAERIERQVWLRVLDRAWSTHLETVAAIREGVHLAAFGGMNPLDVFHEQVADSHEAMWRDVAEGVREGFRQAVAEDGSATGSYGPAAPSATWTHLMAETPEAFSRLPHLVKGAAAAVSAPMLALLAWHDRRHAAKRRNGGMAGAGGSRP